MTCKSFWATVVALGALSLGGCGGGSGGGSPDTTVSGATEAVQSTGTNYVTNQATGGQTTTYTQTQSGTSGTTSTAAASSVATSSASVAPRFAMSVEDMQALGPFPSWANVKTQYGAKGDGVTDDTAALQRAINDLGQPGKAFVLFLPAGTYRITKTLTVKGGGYYQGMEIIGQEPSSTTILWNGPTGGAMLITNGGVNTRFSRITWNGNKTAGYGVAHWWNQTTNPTYFGASYEHSDEVFEDMGIGIMAGRMGTGYNMLDSEGQVRRVKFIRETQAGLSTGSWNALDWWIWDSQFIDCARGVTNRFSVDDSGPAEGAGGFYVYRSLFMRSTVADVNIKNTGWFSMHNNVSVNSRRFFQAEDVGPNSGRVIIQGNRIVNTTDPVSIYNANLGPVILVDNQIRSLPGAVGPVVEMDGSVASYVRDLLSIGNSFTVTTPIFGKGSSNRLVSIADTTVNPSSIATSPPLMPTTPVWALQQVYDVVAGSTTAQIQAVINKAAASGNANPIVHFLPGTYLLTQTLVVPAKVHIQLVGDGWGAHLQWNSTTSDPMLKLEGPSYATVRDLQFIGASNTAIAISGADQQGGRVMIVGSSLAPTSFTNLSQTAIEGQSNPGIRKISIANVASAAFMGTGGIGPVQSAASNVLISDTWYEGSDTDLYRVSSGNFTYLGGQMAPADPSHPGALDPNSPAILLDNFQGTAAFVGFSQHLAGVPSGVGIQIGAETPATKALFIGLANSPNYFNRSSSGGAVGLYLSKTMGSSGAVPVVNQGSSDPSFIVGSLAQMRSLVWDSAPYAAPDGATNVRIYRIKANQVAQGLSVTGN